MSSYPPGGAINTLNDDVLLHIFEFNCDMFTDYYALDTTRITSQVCREWRHLMLATPSLWAKLIDVDQISEPQSPEWRNELVRRSGDAPLWIKAEENSIGIDSNTGLCGSYNDKFLLEVISENWNRVQRIVISHDYHFAYVPRIFFMPAPQLEHFEAAHTWDDKDADAPVRPLFANQAPLLQTIYVDCDMINPRASWLNHLHSLILDDTYSPFDALALLSDAYNLKTLKIVDIETDYPTESLPVISLPHLQDIQFCSTNSNAGIALLDHVKIPAGCSLAIHINGFVNETPNEYERPFIVSTIDKFMRHADRCFQLYTFNRLDLGYKKMDHILVSFETPLPVDRSLKIIVPLHGDSNTTVLKSFLAQIPQLGLTSITDLRFAAHARFTSHFGSFFTRFPSVESISTDLQTLSHLADLDKSAIKRATGKPDVVFPKLRVVCLVPHVKGLQKPSFINQVTSGFLVSRVRAGFPITTLDMSHYPPLDTAPNFQVLGDVKSLTVLYRLSETEGVLEHIYGAKVEKNVSM